MHIFDLVSSLRAAEHKFKIVCYFTNWGKCPRRFADEFEQNFFISWLAYNRPGGGSMTPEDIDPCLCTHVIYAFSEMENNLLIPTEKHDLKDNNRPGREYRWVVLFN